nr:MAG TPA: hypothetical protein [Caudoviricetes sp.]
MFITKTLSIHFLLSFIITSLPKVEQPADRLIMQPRQTLR